MPEKLCLLALALAFRDAGSGDPSHGVKEQPLFSNRGARVDQYLTTAGEPLGQPYCASAVYTWFAESAAKYGVKVPIVRSGYCPDLANYFKTHGLARRRITDAQPGDVILFWVAKERRYGHAGIVLRNDGDGTVKTVEANTVATGSPTVQGHEAEGDGVYVKTRQVAGTRHMVADMQSFVVTAVPEKTQVLSAAHIAAGHAAMAGQTAAPQTAAPLTVTETFHVSLDGAPRPEVHACRIDGQTFIGLTALVTALSGRNVQRCFLSTDKKVLEIQTK